MVMPGPGMKYWCPTHGTQTAHGCVIECPVCAHESFLRTFASREEQEAFEKNWRFTDFNQPWDPNWLDLE